MSKIEKLKDIELDSRNANRGTARGFKQITGSIQRNGFGRSGLLDKNGKAIAGNKTTEASAEVFGVEAEPIIIQTDGKRPVYVQRTDLDLDDPDPNNPARRLAYEDNRAGELGLDWDVENILSDIDLGFDFSDIFDEGEIHRLSEEYRQAQDIEAGVSGSDNYAKMSKSLGDKTKQIKPVLYAADLKTFELAIRQTRLKNRGEALIEICRHYLDTAGQFNIQAEIDIAALSLEIDV